MTMANWVAARHQPVPGHALTLVLGPTHMHATPTMWTSFNPPTVSQLRVRGRQFGASYIYIYIYLIYYSLQFFSLAMPPLSRSLQELAGFCAARSGWAGDRSNRCSCRAWSPSSSITNGLQDAPDASARAGRRPLVTRNARTHNFIPSRANHAATRAPRPHAYVDGWIHERDSTASTPPRARRTCASKRARAGDATSLPCHACMLPSANAHA